MAEKEETEKNIAYNSYIEKCNTDSNEIKGAKSTKQQDTSVTDTQASTIRRNNYVKNYYSATPQNRGQETTANHRCDSTFCGDEDHQPESLPSIPRADRTKCRRRSWSGTEHREKSFNRVGYADVQSNSDTESNDGDRADERGETFSETGVKSASDPSVFTLKNPDPKYEESASAAPYKETPNFDRIYRPQHQQTVMHVGLPDSNHSQLKQPGEIKNGMLSGEAENVPGRQQGKRIPKNSPKRSDRKITSWERYGWSELIPPNSEHSPSSQRQNQSSPQALNHRRENADPKHASFGRDNDHHDSIPERVEPCDKVRPTFTPEPVVSDGHATALSAEQPSPVEAPTPSSTVLTAPLPTETSVPSEQGSQETSLGSSGSTLPGSSSTSHPNVEGLSSEANDQTRTNDELEDKADDTNSENDENEASSERERSTPCQSPPPASPSHPCGDSPALTSPLPPQSEGAAEGTETETEKPRSSQGSPSRGEEGSEEAAGGIESEKQPPFKRPPAACLGCGCQPWQGDHSDPPSPFHHNDPLQASPRLSSSHSPGEVEPEGAVGGVDTENQHSSQTSRFLCPADPVPSHRVSTPPVLSFPRQCFSNGGVESDQRRQHGRYLYPGLHLRSHVALDRNENPEEDDCFYSVRRASRHPVIQAVTHLTFRPADQEEMTNNDGNGEANISSIQEQLLTERGSQVTISDLTMAYNWGDNTRRTCLLCPLPVDVRLVHCYHAVLCRSCANHVDQCPICDADIVAISLLNH